ncbi:glycosyltransferase family 2 protein [Brevibacillus reuszeri]|uniref:glycosyltransferase family 2 protein n=1 Tax=Brevibacillus reuszeri TaxID=54915 RepID=UPI0028992E4C|nr:glycosyltransferase family 2 protein [Brevibacillus reuszeri]
MEELVVWLLAAFGCSSLLVMIAERWIQQMTGIAELPSVHYRLLLRDSEQVLEQVVRKLLFRSYWSGKPIRITLIDEGSVDDTPHISTLLNRYPHCQLFDWQDVVGSGTIVTIDLRSMNHKERF